MERPEAFKSMFNSRLILQLKDQQGLTLMHILTLFTVEKLAGINVAVYILNSEQNV